MQIDKNLFLRYAKKNNLEKQVLESILFKIIIEFFQEKKGINIKDYIISIKVQKNIIIIKTYKAFLNYEFSLYKKEITEIFLEKIEKIGFRKNYEIYFK